MNSSSLATCKPPLHPRAPYLWHLTLLLETLIVPYLLFPERLVYAMSLPMNSLKMHRQIPIDAGFDASTYPLHTLIHTYTYLFFGFFLLELQDEGRVENSFLVKSSNKTFIVYSKTPEERTSWFNDLQKVIGVRTWGPNGGIF